MICPGLQKYTGQVVRKAAGQVKAPNCWGPSGKTYFFCLLQQWRVLWIYPTFWSLEKKSGALSPVQCCHHSNLPKPAKMRPSVKWKYVFHKIGMGKRSEALQWLIPYGPMDFNLHYHSGVADNAALLPACMLMVYIWRWCTKPACMLTVYIWRWCTKQTDDYQ